MARAAASAGDLEMVEVNLYPEKKKEDVAVDVGGTETGTTPNESRIQRLARLADRHKWRLLAAVAAIVIIAALTLGLVIAYQTGGDSGRTTDSTTGGLPVTTYIPVTGTSTTGGLPVTTSTSVTGTSLNGKGDDNQESGNVTSLDGGRTYDNATNQITWTDQPKDDDMRNASSLGTGLANTTSAMSTSTNAGKVSMISLPPRIGKCYFLFFALFIFLLLCVEGSVAKERNLPGSDIQNGSVLIL